MNTFSRDPKPFCLSARSDYTLRMNLLDPLFRSAAVDAVFSDRCTLQGMLDFEAAFARAAARVGVIPQSAGIAIASKCRADERDLGGWHAEWEVLPDIVHLTGGVVHQLATIVRGFEIDAQRMQRNLDLPEGLIFAEAVTMALGEKIGKGQAHEIVEAACKRALRDKRELRAILSGDPKVSAHLSIGDLDRLFDPRNYLGAAEEYVYRVVAASRGKIPVGEE